MNFSDLSSTLLAACGKDTVKVFDISKQPNDGLKQASDPCVLTYTPSPGLQVNSVKWNHTSKLLLPFCSFSFVSLLLLLEGAILIFIFIFIL